MVDAAMGAPDYSIRPIDHSDLPWFLEVRNDSREMLHDQRSFGLDDATRWLEATSPDVRIIRFGAEPVGYFRVGPIERRGGVTLLWIGCDIAPEKRRRGHAEAAYRAFSDQLRDEYGADALVLRVLPGNFPALELYRKLGFRTTRAVAERSEDGRELRLLDLEMALIPGDAGVHASFEELILDLAPSSIDREPHGEGDM